MARSAEAEAGGEAVVGKWVDFGNYPPEESMVEEPPVLLIVPSADKSCATQKKERIRWHDEDFCIPTIGLRCPKSEI